VPFGFDSFSPVLNTLRCSAVPSGIDASEYSWLWLQHRLRFQYALLECKKKWKQVTSMKKHEKQQNHVFQAPKIRTPAK
jgi:hypothetical protein